MVGINYVAMKYCSVCNANHFPGTPPCVADFSYELTVSGTGWTCATCGVFVSPNDSHTCNFFTSVPVPPQPYPMPYFPPTPIKQETGWQCPACKKVYAPWWPSCDCENE